MNSCEARGLCRGLKVEITLRVVFGDVYLETIAKMFDAKTQDELRRHVEKIYRDRKPGGAEKFDVEVRIGKGNEIIF